MPQALRRSTARDLGASHATPHSNAAIPTATATRLKQQAQLAASSGWHDGCKFHIHHCGERSDRRSPQANGGRHWITTSTQTRTGAGGFFFAQRMRQVYASTHRQVQTGFARSCVGLLLTALLSGLQPLATASGFDALDAQLSTLIRDAQALERRLGQADAVGLDLYVGTQADDLLLRKIELRIDDEPATTYEYSAAESAALAGRDLHHALSRALPAGEHRLRAVLISREIGALPTTPRVVARIDRTIEKSAAPLTLELRQVDGGFRKPPQIEIHPALDRGALRQRAARLLQTLGRTLAATVELDGLPPLAATDAQPSSTAGDAAPSLLTRFNQAVEQIRQGDAEQGRAALDAIGQSPLKDSTSLRMRDMANLTLGYELLRLRRGKDALPVLSRVRSPGPYGNQALLGLGWAHLAPSAKADTGSTPERSDDRLWPVVVEDTPEARRATPFRNAWAVAMGRRGDDLRDALAAWTELIGRDPIDPAVQEGLLVVPYALGHLGAHEQSARYLQRAIDQLDLARNELDAAVEHVHSGMLTRAIDTGVAGADDGWRWQLADLSYSDDSAYVRYLIAQRSFIDAFERYRHLREAAALLDLHAIRLQTTPDGGGEVAAMAARIAALRARVDQDTAAQRSQLEGTAVAQLDQLKQHTGRYLIEARFTLARIHDRNLDGDDALAMRVDP
jgi:tetratricopeptide (TPR) repeat protein